MSARKHDEVEFDAVACRKFGRLIERHAHLLRAVVDLVRGVGRQRSGRFECPLAVEERLRGIKFELCRREVVLGGGRERYATHRVRGTALDRQLDNGAEVAKLQRYGIGLLSKVLRLGLHHHVVGEV